MKRWRAFAMAAFLTSITTSCDRAEPGRVARSDEVLKVALSRPIQTPAASIFPATVEASDQVELATRISGIVEGVQVDVGSRVARGGVLVMLDDRDLEARIDGAEASVRRFERAFQRMEALARDGAATEQELDNARASREMAVASLAEVNAQRAYSILRAPFAGTVTGRSVDPGDLATPGRSILTLVGDGATKVVADLPERVGAWLRAGDSAWVEEPGTGVRLAARIARVSPAVETRTRRFRIEAEFLTAGVDVSALRPGSYVGLGLEDPSRSTLWVPEDAVVHQGQLTTVFLVERDTLRIRWIRPGRSRPEAVEVLSGLRFDESVVRNATPRLVDGQPVEVLTRDEPISP